MKCRVHSPKTVTAWRLSDNFRPADLARHPRPDDPTKVRRGTTSLFAALDIASGSVIAAHYRRHRHQEFLRFLTTIDAAAPTDLDLHLILRQRHPQDRRGPGRSW